MRGPCPGTGWALAHVVTSKVSNQANGVDRPIFDYECGPGQPASCPASAVDYPRITTVGLQLYVDDNVSDSLREMRVSTAVFLRNQNEPPTASATWSRKATSQVTLNGAASTDPEGRTLDFYWFKGTAPTAADFADCTADPAAAVGSGTTYTHTFTEPVGSTVNFWLVVRDPGCLTNTYSDLRGGALMTVDRYKQERGFAMVTAIVLLSLMFGLGLIALRATETNAHRSREQRVRESSLSLDEGVLYAQSLVLSTSGPNTLNPLLPPAARRAGRPATSCPNAATLAGSATAQLRQRRPARQLDLEDEGARQRRCAEERV